MTRPIPANPQKRTERMTPQDTAPVVLLSGASQGIGRVTAALLASSGYRVFGTSRRPAETQPIPGVTLLALDVHAADSIRDCVQAVLDQAGRIDVLINNAGLIGPGTASEEADIDCLRALFETNFFGVVQLTNAVLPILRAQGSGFVLNMGSVSGQVALPPFFTFYAASKHALEAYTEGLRHELRPFGIRVALIEPGYTSTEIGDSIQHPDRPIPAYQEARLAITQLDRAGLRYGIPPEQVARRVLQVLGQRRPALRHPVGAQGAAILLARRWLPGPLFELLARALFDTWKPSPEAAAEGKIPTPRELGLHRLMFHTPTFNRLLRALALILCGAAAFFWKVGVRRKKRADG
jgi:NAD(P)-dependent dehydrogenase (short-subunit alcohol dehydrogenase family)